MLWVFAIHTVLPWGKKKRLKILTQSFVCISAFGWAKIDVWAGNDDFHSKALLIFKVSEIYISTIKLEYLFFFCVDVPFSVLSHIHTKQNQSVAICNNPNLHYIFIIK